MNLLEKKEQKHTKAESTSKTPRPGGLRNRLLLSLLTSVSSQLTAGCAFAVRTDSKNSTYEKAISRKRHEQLLARVLPSIKDQVRDLAGLQFSPEQIRFKVDEDSYGVTYCLGDAVEQGEKMGYLKEPFVALTDTLVEKRTECLQKAALLDEKNLGYQFGYVVVHELEHHNSCVNRKAQSLPGIASIFEEILADSKASFFVIKRAINDPKKYISMSRACNEDTYGKIGPAARRLLVSIEEQGSILQFGFDYLTTPTLDPKEWENKGSLTFSPEQLQALEKYYRKEIQQIKSDFDKFLTPTRIEKTLRKLLISSSSSREALEVWATLGRQYIDVRGTAENHRLQKLVEYVERKLQ